MGKQTVVERQVHGPKPFEYTYKSSDVVANYKGFRSPDGHILLLLSGGGFNTTHPRIFEPVELVVRSPEDAINQAIRLREEVSQMFRQAREGGFYERMGRLSTGTRSSFRELELKADILEDLGLTLETRRKFGAHINPRTIDYSKLTDEQLLDIALGETRGDVRKAAAELRRRGIIDDKTEMMWFRD